MAWLTRGPWRLAATPAGPKPDEAARTILLRARRRKAGFTTHPRTDPPALPDHEELYHEAWADLLERWRRTGEPIANYRALLKKIAWRRATDLPRKHKPDYVDPASIILATAIDAAVPTDEQVQGRLDGEAFPLVVESLDGRQSAALKPRFDVGLTGRESRERRHGSSSASGLP